MQVTLTAAIQAAREALKRADMQLQMLHGVHCTDTTFDDEYIANNNKQRNLISVALAALPSEPKSEEQLLEIISPYHCGNRDEGVRIVAALRDAGCLFVAEQEGK